MKRYAVLALALLVITTPVAQARPSFRSIRESAEGEKHDKNDPTSAGWRHQYFQEPGWGLRVTYPSSWNKPVITSGASSDGSIPYEYARLIPHDQEVGRRSNYILELYAYRWDVGKEMTMDEIETFIQNETKPRYQSYWFEDEFDADPIAGYEARTRIFTSMTGYREETWFSAGRYLYILGFRSLYDFIEDNHFFYEDMIASSVITPITEAPEPEIISDKMPSVIDDPQSGIFSDIEKTHPYAPAIMWAKDEEIIGGYPDGTFQPDRTVNRAELAKILEPLHSAVLNKHNLAWRPTTKVDCLTIFPDVPTDAWFAYPVCFGKFFGLLNGYPDGTFKPERTVNVAEALKMTYGAADIGTLDSGPHWYSRYYDHALKNSILFETLDPNAEMKRKDVVWMLWKLLNE